MNEKLTKIQTVSNRLVSALTVLLCISILGSFFAGNLGMALAIFAVGVIGGFVGLQRRLKKMSDDDLTLLANSWVYICLSPLTGGILAVVIYILFLSGMLQGELFPSLPPTLFTRATKDCRCFFRFTVRPPRIMERLCCGGLSLGFRSGSPPTSSVVLNPTLHLRINRAPNHESESIPSSLPRKQWLGR